MSLRVPSSSNCKSLNEAGFSLLELAIVLVILGIIGGLSLPLLTSQINRSAIQKTRTNQSYALHAIAAYVEKNRRFPCPGDSLSLGPTYGISRLHCQGDKAKGILPFKTLGISEVYAKDGFNHLMAYAVEPNLTKRDADLPRESGGYITVKREDGTPVLAPPQKGDPNPNYVAIVLISHGSEFAPALHGENSFAFNESLQKGNILKWESRDLFLKHYVKIN